MVPPYISLLFLLPFSTPSSLPLLPSFLSVRIEREPRESI
ncbi:hypothetical protein SLEP1_g54846 [Rubroshorea leprosula]|uniref:Uncharacterized protein n=1 Tax=Rubroshorea leprosula TaxID=152421 RepID=A0AAV5MGL7_9ROSI|nr:hypothetical protein SLEP1_g54846 [Rubroshorea leprosula]